jgi:hypothetical protein
MKWNTREHSQYCLRNNECYCPTVSCHQRSLTISSVPFKIYKGDSGFSASAKEMNDWLCETRLLLSNGFSRNAWHSSDHRLGSLPK